MDKAKGKRIEHTQGSPDTQAKADIKKAGNGAIWIRDDGAICIDNECIVLKGQPTGELKFTIDPDRCSCDIDTVLIQALIESAVSGRGINLEIKPRKETK